MDDWVTVESTTVADDTAEMAETTEKLCQLVSELVCKRKRLEDIVGKSKVITCLRIEWRYEGIALTEEV